MEERKSVSCGEALTALGVIGLCVAFALHYPEKSEDWAAWMQAFGSVAAIAGSGWIARGQIREAQRVEQERREAERKSNAEARIEQLQAVAVFVEQLFKTLDKTAVHLSTRIMPHELTGYARTRVAPLKVAISALSEIPLHQVPQAYIGLPVLNISNCAAHVVQILEDVASAEPATEADWVSLSKNAADAVVKYRDRASHDLEQLRALTEKYDGIKSPVILARHLD